MSMQCVSSKVEQVFAQKGWTLERLRLGATQWAAASKKFESAGGARTAVIYLQPTAQEGLYLHGTYVSAGEDVLAGHICMLSARETEELEAQLPAYLEEAARRIEASWGRRVLRILRAH